MSTRLVPVIITAVIVVAVALILVIRSNTITITTFSFASSSPHRDDARAAVLITEVMKAGDDVVVKLNSEEASCDSQIAQLASQSTVSAAATQAAIDKGTGEVNAANQPFLDQIKADEDGFGRLSTISALEEGVFLERIHGVQVTALGENGSRGKLILVCQTALSETSQIIQPPVGGGDD